MKIIKKIKDLIRGTPTLRAGTLDEWRAWERAAKKKNPTGYWLVEEFLPRLEKLNVDIKKPVYWYRNRFLNKTHALTSRQLERGQYHEIDTRILYCLFDTLTDFVECELAPLALMLASLKHSSSDDPFPKRKKGCNPALGVAHLKWEMTLVDDDDGKPTPQAQAATEVLELYTWWTSLRPSRPDPDALGYDESMKLEKQYLDEDQRMLHRLIDVRSSLWT